MPAYTDGYFFCPELPAASSEVALDAGESRHIAAVLRLKPGASIFLTDGRGRLARAEITETGKNQVLCLVQEYTAVDEPAPLLTVACGFLQRHDFDEVVEGLCGLGVKTIIPLLSQNVQFFPKQPDKILARWQGKARVALKQSKGVWLTEIHAFMETPELLAGLAAYNRVFLLDQAAETKLPPSAPAGPLLALCGPEGGFTREEQEAFKQAGALALALSRRRLRAGLAAVAGAAVISLSHGYS